MKRQALVLLMAMGFYASPSVAQDIVNTALPRRITLQEAVQLARANNHNIRIADYTVEEKQRAKEVARSAYFPSIRNDTNYLHVTDTQLIQIDAGSFGTAAGALIPPKNVIITRAASI